MLAANVSGPFHDVQISPRQYEQAMIRPSKGSGRGKGAQLPTKRDQHPELCLALLGLACRHSKSRSRCLRWILVGCFSK